MTSGLAWRLTCWGRAGADLGLARRPVDHRDRDRLGELVEHNRVSRKEELDG